MEMRVQPSMIERRVLKPFLAKAGHEYDGWVTSWRDTESAKSSKATLKSIIEGSGLFVLDEKDGAVIGVAKGRSSVTKTASAATPTKRRGSTSTKARKSVEKTPRKSPGRGVKRERDGEALDDHGDGASLDLTAELTRLCQMFRKKLKMDDVVSDESGKTPAALLEQLKLMAMVLPREDETNLRLDQFFQEEEDAEHAPVGENAEAEEREEQEVQPMDVDKNDSVSVEQAPAEPSGVTNQVPMAVEPTEEPAAAAATDETEETVAPPAAKRRKLTIIRPGDAGYDEALQQQSSKSQANKQRQKNGEKNQNPQQPQMNTTKPVKPQSVQNKQQQQQQQPQKQQQQQQQRRDPNPSNQKQQEHPQGQQIFAVLRNIRKANPIMVGSNVVTVCVLDTNCLLHHSVEVSELRSYSHVLVKIPLAVVRELDGLKTNKDTNVARDARRAINLILNFVEGFNTNFQLQTTSEIVETRGESHSTNNDERIVKACLYYRAALSNPVVLVTDDVNLRLKARAFEVSQKSLEEFMAEARKLAPQMVFPTIAPAPAPDGAATASRRHRPHPRKNSPQTKLQQPVPAPVPAPAPVSSQVPAPVVTGVNVSRRPRSHRPHPRKNSPQMKFQAATPAPVPAPGPAAAAAVVTTTTTTTPAVPRHRPRHRRGNKNRNNRNQDNKQ